MKALSQQTATISFCLSIALTLVGLGGSVLAQAAHPLVGPWHGGIEVPPGIALRMQVNFKLDGESLQAEMLIPEQTAAVLPLEKVSFVEDRVSFELPAGIGRATYSGALKDGRISGVFQQNGMKGTFHLQPGPLPAPQVDPLPGKHEEVLISAGANSLAGTLSQPEGQGPFTALLLITGSGGQTRDEEVAGFAIFRELTRFFLTQGWAVLRCDDRGIGSSTGDAATVTTHTNTDDAEAALRWLMARKEVDAQRIGVLGHSEGGVIAPILAGRVPSIAFLVLLAPACVRGDELLYRQGELLLRAGGGPSSMVTAKKALQAALFHWMRTGEGRAEAEALVREEALAARAQMPAKMREASTEEAFVEDYIKTAWRQMDNPWMRTFIDLDPAPHLSALNCPVLALFGARDLQVPASQSRPALEAAFADKPKLLHCVTIPKANHLFQAALTGGVHEYTTLKKEFVPGMLEELAAFLRARAAAAKH